MTVRAAASTLPPRPRVPVGRVEAPNSEHGGHPGFSDSRQGCLETLPIFTTACLGWPRPGAVGTPRRMGTQRACSTLFQLNRLSEWRFLGLLFSCSREAKRGQGRGQGRDQRRTASSTWTGTYMRARHTQGGSISLMTKPSTPSPCVSMPGPVASGDDE